MELRTHARPRVEAMPCRIRSVVAGSVRALWWSDDAAVNGVLVVRAERNAAPCGALHAAVAVEDGARETVGSTVLAVVRWCDRLRYRTYWYL